MAVVEIDQVAAASTIRRLAPSILQSRLVIDRIAESYTRPLREGRQGQYAVICTNTGRRLPTAGQPAFPRHTHPPPSIPRPLPRHQCCRSIEHVDPHQGFLPIPVIAREPGLGA